MPKIICSAAQCGHNRENYCCLQSVLVEGEGAVKVDETCCDSFEPRNAGRFEGEYPKSRIDIECAAENCVFNSGGNCDAHTISVEGAEATKPETTSCSSFMNNC